MNSPEKLDLVIKTIKDTKEQLQKLEDIEGALREIAPHLSREDSDLVIKELNSLKTQLQSLMGVV